MMKNTANERAEKKEDMWRRRKHKKEEEAEWEDDEEHSERDRWGQEWEGEYV